ncbi:L-ascorbate oxidase-like [Dendroctonus ponderosae]|nr:L-ascorbate oxidase [Dendroctonus ponderosae]XP_048526011.1 L-ascorbate oxidase-like [Dendroctonus ponderosae]
MVESEEKNNNRKEINMSASQSLLIRLCIVLGMVAAVLTVVYFTPMPDQNFKSCDRPCHELDWPMICRIKLNIEMYHTDNHICQDCRRNSSHPLSSCNNIFCQMTEASNPRTIITANRQIPGPPIQVCQNDILIVDVINRVPGKSVTLHWRGQPNHEAPFMDGVPMVTQCPIPSYTTFQYKFRASKPGTHFYHAYMDADRSNGLFGALIVRKSDRTEPSKKMYDVDSKDHYILISEWSGDFSHPSPTDRDLSKALLVNGKAPSERGSSLTMFNVKPGRRHRFRVAYTSGLSGCPVNLTVDNHLLKIIELDGNPTNPHEVSSIRISKGERIDFILKASQEIGAYYLSVKSSCESSDLHGLAVINYEGRPKGTEKKGGKIANDGGEKNTKLKRHFDTSLCRTESGKVCLGDVKSLDKMPKELRKETVDRNIFLAIDYKYGERETDYEQYADLRKKIYRINNLTFSYPASPLLTQPMDVPSNLICNELSIPEKCQKRNICECVHLEAVDLGTSVEIMIVEQGGDDEHILHFHGNHFYIVGSRQFERPMSRKEIRELDQAGSLLKRNLNNPVLKDTIRIPRFGVVILRFLAKNPGIWMLRDENSHGWSKGLDLAIEVGERHQMVSTPSNFPTCGDYIGPEFFLL